MSILSWSELQDLCLESLDGLAAEADEDEDCDDDWPLESDSLPLGARLDALVARSCHLPSPETADLLKMRCQVHLEADERRAAAVAAVHSQGVMFRHRVLVEYNKRQRRRQEANGKADKSDKDEPESERDLFSSEDDGEANEARAERLFRQSVAFQDLAVAAAASGETSGAQSQLGQILQSLPEDWRIVQISCKPTLACRFRAPSDLATQSENNADLTWRDRNPALYLTAMHCGQNSKATVIEVPALYNADRPTVMHELNDIVHEHRFIYKKTENFDQAKYDRAREELDDRMRSLLSSVENKYLGYAKVLLLGRPSDPARVEAVEATAERLLRRLRVSPSSGPEWEHKLLLLTALLEGSSYLMPDQVAYACAQFTDKKAVLKDLLSTIAEHGAAEKSDNMDRGPVVLILDSDVQQFPWESLSVMENQSVSRVPSLFFLKALFDFHQGSKSSVTQFGVSNEKIFYILNPNKDLDKTERRLKEKFRSHLGQGAVGHWPSQERMKGALSDMDAFMYCGHGSRLETLRAQEIERLRVRAVPLLFGCGTGRLERLGRAFDPVGCAHSYLVAAAPALLGFLWAVTDQDLDKWTVALLDHWLGDGGESDFVRAASQKRQAFARLMNGAALVIYGLPAFLSDDRKG